MEKTTTNGLMAVQLSDAHNCLQHLAQRRLKILKIQLQDQRNPRLIIEAKNNTPGGLVGGMKRITDRAVTYATSLHDCQVEWEVPK